MKPNRLMILDDNIRSVGGHFFELMSLLAQSASERDIPVHVAANAAFQHAGPLPHGLSVDPVFRTRRMVQWSMGPDGDGQLRRTIDGRLVGSMPRRLLQAARDRLRVPRKRPAHMLRVWQQDCAAWLRQSGATDNDLVLVTTTDDFGLLALAAALGQHDRPLRVDAIVHYSLLDPSSSPQNPAVHDQPARERLGRIGRQIRDAMQLAGVELQGTNRGLQGTNRRHRVRLLATTPGLADQYTAARTGLGVGSFDYPTRAAALSRPVADENRSRRIVCGLAGWPRAEKGAPAIASLVADSVPMMDRGECQMAIQMRREQIDSVLPKSIRPRVCVDGDDPSAPVVVRTGVLSTADYHGWLDRLDIGIFLYDPRRYAVRCSGVLLELMVRGVPVIVPDDCHLADQVRRYGGHDQTGYIYRDRHEVPRWIASFAEDRDRVTAACRAIAKSVRDAHDPGRLLSMIGESDPDNKMPAAAA